MLEETLRRLETHITQLPSTRRGSPFYQFPSWLPSLYVFVTYSQGREFLPPEEHEGGVSGGHFLQEILFNVFLIGLEKYPRMSVFYNK